MPVATEAVKESIRKGEQKRWREAGKERGQETQQLDGTKEKGYRVYFHPDGVKGAGFNLLIPPKMFQVYPKPHQNAGH